LKKYLASFYRKAYSDNVTGLSGMVAYNMLLSVFPVALLALFVAGRLLRSHELESSVLKDLQQLFPTAADRTLTRALEGVRDSSTSLGVFAAVSSVWIGASFWGALDTAFCRIYHVRCRGWVEQKRFALAMLLVVLLFMAATVAVPALQSLMTSGAKDLPFGLSSVGGVAYALSLLAGLVLLFAILCLVYWAVPHRLVPWGSIWPGASAATLAIAIVDYAFPAYLNNISSISHVGTTFVFVLIVLVWFYVLALIILGGAIVNAMRFELHESGRIADPVE
jgi:membrane protein